MHEVDDFILSVMTRFQNRASLGQTTDIASDERTVQRQLASSQHEQTLHTRVRDDTKFPDAVDSTRGGARNSPHNQ